MLTPIERLKFEVLAEGVRLSGEARTRLAGAHEEQPLTLADYATTSGIPLRLPGEIWVNAPLADHNPNFVRNPPHLLDWGPDGFILCSHGAVVPVEPTAVPEYSMHRNSAGEPHSWYGVTHTDRVRISPIGGCANACAFCDLPRTSEYRLKRVDPLCECIQEALKEYGLAIYAAANRP